MHAVVLVGGFGTRLRPLTNTVPKSMLPIANVPLIVRLIGRLERGGSTTSRWRSGSCPSRSSRPSPTVAAAGSRSTTPSSPSRSTRPARSASPPTTPASTTRSSSPTATSSPTCRSPISSPPTGPPSAEATIHLIPVEDPSAFGVVELDDGGRIRRSSRSRRRHRAEQPDQRRHLRVRASVLERIPPGRRVSIERETFPLFADGGRFHAMATDDYWIDAGRPGAVPAGQPRPRQRPPRRDVRSRSPTTPTSHADAVVERASSGPARASVPRARGHRFGAAARRRGRSPARSSRTRSWPARSATARRSFAPWSAPTP